MTRTHLNYSADPITVSVVDQPASPEMKPKGFWYEVDGDWRRWCSDERWGTDARHLHSLDIGDTRLLVIDTLAKLDAFHEEYAEPLAGTSRAINWAPVADRWDGIEIAPYQWERRCAPGFLWYYGWDCASGCIWRPNGATVGFLTELPADWHETEPVA